MYPLGIISINNTGYKTFFHDLEIFKIPAGRNGPFVFGRSDIQHCFCCLLSSFLPAAGNLRLTDTLVIVAVVCVVIVVVVVVVSVIIAVIVKT